MPTSLESIVRVVADVRNRSNEPRENRRNGVDGIWECDRARQCGACGRRGNVDCRAQVQAVSTNAGEPWTGGMRHPIERDRRTPPIDSPPTERVTLTRRAPESTRSKCEYRVLCRDNGDPGAPDLQDGAAEVRRHFIALRIRKGRGHSYA